MEIMYEIFDNEKVNSVSGSGCFAKCVKSNPDYGSGGGGQKGKCFAACAVTTNNGTDD